MSRKQKVKC